MKKSAKIVVILFAFFLEFAWWAWPRVSAHGYAEDPYRLSERMTALSEWSGNPTLKTNTNLQKEIKLLDEHEHTAIKQGAVVLANVFGILLFCKCTPKKTVV